MLRPSRSVVLVVTLVLAGCGGGGDESSSAPAAEKRSPDEQAVADLAARYLDAFSNEDFEAVCETRTRKEQRELAKLAGSCPKAFALVLKKEPGATEVFADTRIGEVRVTGDEASAEMLQPGQTESPGVLLAERENGRWGLVSDESRTPPD